MYSLHGLIQEFSRFYSGPPLGVEILIRFAHASQVNYTCVFVLCVLLFIAVLLMTESGLLRAIVLVLLAEIL